MYSQNPKSRVWVLLCAAAVVLGALIQPGAAYAEKSEFDYPELTVTPRASDRIKMEADQEAASRWTLHLPIQLSGLTTLVAGIANYADTNGASVAGVSVGAGWLALTVGLSALYHPYANASATLAALPHESVRDQLTRERIAEEHMEAAASLGTKLCWLSFLSNAGSGAYMFAGANGNQTAQVFDIASIALAFTPILFPYRWNQVASEQMRYKKKIYGPVATAALLPEPGTRRPVPGAMLSISF